MEQVEGRTAFITGGGSGIGLGMAEVFAAAGMNLVLADIREDHLADARERASAGGWSERALFLPLDVTDRPAFAAAADAAEARFGAIHILCNNAGIGIVPSIANATYADWDWAIDVNLNAIFNGVHTVLPRIRAHGEGGHIVNTASMAGILQYSMLGLYVTTKFAVVGFSEALHAELRGEGIGVSAFCPGGVHSNIRDYERTRPERFAVARDDGPRGGPGFSMSAADREKLGRLTATPQEAGEIVLRGIRDDALYIFTAPEFRPGIRDRFEAILRATGEDKEREEIALALIPGLIGSPIYAASMVGGDSGCQSQQTT